MRIAYSLYLALAAVSGRHVHHRHHRHNDSAPAASVVAAGPTPAATPVAAAAPAAAVAAAGPTPAVPAAVPPATTPGPATTAATTTTVAASTNEAAEKKQEYKEEIDDLKKRIQEKKQKIDRATGRLIVNGPLPTNFSSLFAESVATATGCDKEDVVVIEANPVNAVDADESKYESKEVSKDESEDTSKDDAEPTTFVQETTPSIVEVVYEAPSWVVESVAKQAAEEGSALASGPLQPFLVAKESTDSVPERGIDLDTEMPYGQIEPFGREDTAGELTKDSINESDAMVDQVERAEIAEEKRAVFRALTRLRGAAISSFDGIARSQTGAVDAYAKTHRWRRTHPLHHLAEEEADVSKWAFPDSSSF